jgi:predicted DCC family thiol-disulfide oxidoreductase YuxK
VTVPPPPPEDRHPIVLYDGTCGWCTGWAAWLCRRDRAGVFRLAPLDGATARRVLDGPPPADTMVLVLPAAQGPPRRLTESDAVLGVLRRLGWPWRALGALAVVPRPLRDPCYRWIARRRHALPGAAAACDSARDPAGIPPARRLP